MQPEPEAHPSLPCAQVSREVRRSAQGQTQKELQQVATGQPRSQKQREMQQVAIAEAAF